MWTQWGLNWFFLPNPIFVIYLNFQQQNPLKNQYLSHLNSENCKIKSIKSDSPSTFQEHHKHPQIPIEISVSTLFNFHWKNDSIINSFYTIAPSNLKPSWCTFIHWEFSKDTKSIAWSALISVTKQNNMLTA
jgi:hypothetical protein